MRIYS